MSGIRVEFDDDAERLYIFRGSSTIVGTDALNRSFSKQERRLSLNRNGGVLLFRIEVSSFHCFP